MIVNAMTRRIFVAAAGSAVFAGAGMAKAAASAVDPFRFPGFMPLRHKVADVAFSGQIGGSGPPLLLLHGYPETHIAWRHIAPELAKSYTIIAPDLPGYGDSHIVADSGSRWDKRRVAQALAKLMASLGHERYMVVSHDRGARVGYRLALDYPAAVAAYSSLTVVPIIDVWPTVNKEFATKNFHWFLFAQSGDLPEKLLSGNPDAVLDYELHGMTGGKAFLEPAVVARYREAFRRASVRHYMCEDYRAALVEDSAADSADRDAGRKMPCPVQVLWSNKEVPLGGPTPIDTWKRWTSDVTGRGFDAGHLLPEETPDEILAALRPFLAANAPRLVV
jgi:haloacetate dehalogenase